MNHKNRINEQPKNSLVNLKLLFGVHKNGQPFWPWFGQKGTICMSLKK